MNNIDKEWNQYLFSQGLETHERENIKTKIKIKEDQTHVNMDKKEIQLIPDNEISPKCNELIISTKTKVLFLNTEVDIHKIFWDIPIIEYGNPTTGVLKKQIKVVSKTEEEYQEYRKKIENIPFYREHIIKKIANPVVSQTTEKDESWFRVSRRIKFKDERKITIGISKKDIMNCRLKSKNAFYNCFALIMRFQYHGVFKEIHVKVFNTGKLEIPGILNLELFDIIRALILKTLQPHISTPLFFMENKKTENVLINSNFNCGYYINREKLYHLLRSDKYGIEASYDPCSYPGVKCKFYFNNNAEIDDTQNGKIVPEDRNMKMSDLMKNKKYTEISFMIFRTGSVLIVGNCCEEILDFVFVFVKNMLQTEYSDISVINEGPIIKNKKTKVRKRIITIS